MCFSYIQLPNRGCYGACFYENGTQFDNSPILMQGDI